MTVTSVLTNITKLIEIKQPFIMRVTAKTTLGYDFVEVKIAEC